MTTVLSKIQLPATAELRKDELIRTIIAGGFKLRSVPIKSTLSTVGTIR